MDQKKNMYLPLLTIHPVAINSFSRIRGSLQTWTSNNSMLESIGPNLYVFLEHVSHSTTNIPSKIEEKCISFKTFKT